MAAGNLIAMSGEALGSERGQSVRAVGAPRRRRISPQAGRGLEILGHAIEYLTDEHVHEGGEFTSAEPRMQAVHLLMWLNREIYSACPEVPSFRHRLLSWFRAD